MNDEPELNSDELEAIARSAAQLPALTPSRDLWSGIEARIQAPIVALPTRIVHDDTARELPVAPVEVQPARLPWRRLAIAASLLIAATAGITYSLVKPNAAPEVASTNDSASVEAKLPAVPVQAVSAQTAEQTFDREIGAMRNIIDQRRGDLDSATVAVLEKNLKVIDAAIAESKAALAKDPASAFLMDRLTHAYDTKLQLLSGVAAMPSHG
jgi:hypothetical protein